MCRRIASWSNFYRLVAPCLADKASILARKAKMLAEMRLAAEGNLDDPVVVVGNLDVGARGIVEVA